MYLLWPKINIIFFSHLLHSSSIYIFSSQCQRISVRTGKKGHMKMMCRHEVIVGLFHFTQDPDADAQQSVADEKTCSYCGNLYKTPGCRCKFCTNTVVYCSRGCQVNPKIFESYKFWVDLSLIIESDAFSYNQRDKLILYSSIQNITRTVRYKSTYLNVHFSNSLILAQYNLFSKFVQLYCTHYLTYGLIQTNNYRNCTGTNTGYTVQRQWSICKILPVICIKLRKFLTSP